MYIPDEVRLFLEKRPGCSGADVARHFGIPDRTARRYVMNAKRSPFSGAHTSRNYAAWAETREQEAQFDAAEFLARAPKLVKQAQAKDPVFIQDTLTFKGDRPVGIIWVSCMHLGGRYTAYEEFREVYEQARDIPGLYWGSLGDDIEGFLSTFPDQAAIKEQLLPVENQIELLETILSPLAESRRLLFGSGSQHGGKWLNKRTGSNPVKQMYLDLGVPFFDGQAYLKLDVGKQTYHVGMSHEFPGSSNINPNYPQARALRERYPNADVIVMGDRHNPAMQWYSIYKDEYEAGNRSSPYVWLLQAGTAKTGPDKYTIQSWPTGILGWPITIFYPDRHAIKCTMDLEDAALWLEL